MNCGYNMRDALFVCEVVTFEARDRVSYTFALAAFLFYSFGTSNFFGEGISMNLKILRPSK